MSRYIGKATERSNSRVDGGTVSSATFTDREVRTPGGRVQSLHRESNHFCFVVRYGVGFVAQRDLTVPITVSRLLKFREARDS